jgi:UPF0755 protein
VIVKSFIRFKLFLLISIAAIVISAANILAGYLFLPGKLDQEKVIVIKPKLSIHKISKLLAKEKVIRYSSLFEFIAKVYAYHRPLKSGEYEFTRRITPYQVMSTLASGRSVVHRFVIPEGMMVSEIVEKLNLEERLVGTISSSIPEGYLMPSTYFYSYGDQREKIIDIMRQNMSVALDEVMQKLPPKSPLKTRKDVLIMASIIEKEAGNDSERAMVSGALMNRLKKGMKLQADPTVAYAVTEGKYKLSRALTRRDLQINSPYNTYHIQGLPAGPISCPGRASLEAAVAPAKTNALYFVVDGNGGHHFSNTLEQHNIYVQQFRARSRQQAASKPVSPS